MDAAPQSKPRTAGPCRRLRVVELSLLVANAVRERRPELELLVRAEVDAELARVTGELVEQELAARRNGAGAELPVVPAEESSTPDPEQEAPLGMRRCTRCEEVKPLDGARRSSPR